MSWSSTYPAAVTALVAGVTAWPAIAAADDLVVVKDGGTLADPDALRVISFGYVNDTDDTNAENTTVAQGLSRERDRESVTVHNALVVATGDEDIPPARQAAFDLLAAVGAYLAANHTLGGTVMSARITGWSLRTDQTDAGFRVQLDFEIAMEAFTNR